MDKRANIKKIFDYKEDVKLELLHRLFIYRVSNRDAVGWFPTPYSLDVKVERYFSLNEYYPLGISKKGEYITTRERVKFRELK